MKDSRSTQITMPGFSAAGMRADLLFPAEEPMDTDSIMIFSGSANPRLVEDVCNSLNVHPGHATVDRFRDGEVNVEINDSVRGKEVFIVNSTCRPTNEHLVELIIMIDAVRRASAARITAVIPYFGYARQDRRTRSARVPISAKVVANVISAAGANRALTVDLHADQIQGFFDIPVDNIYASPLLIGDVWRKELSDPVVVSPDVGGVVRARAMAKQLDEADLAIIDKRRRRANEAEVMNIIGDVEGRTCVIVDDLADTAGTLCEGAKALKRQGAERVFAYCTHPVLSHPAVDNIEGSELDELVVTDTIPLDARAARCPRIRQLSIAELLAESIRRISTGQSVGQLFMD